MAQSLERRLLTADERFPARLSILFESPISRQLLQYIQRSTLIGNTLTDVLVEHGPWLQPALQLEETWVGG